MRLLMEGLTSAQVGAHPDVKVHRTTVERWAKVLGVKAPRAKRGATRKVSATRIIKLRKRKVDGKPVFTYEEIAGICGCSRAWVSRVLSQARRDGKL